MIDLYLLALRPSRSNLWPSAELSSASLLRRSALCLPVNFCTWTPNGKVQLDSRWPVVK
jgi:hypothetical protein